MKHRFRVRNERDGANVFEYERTDKNKEPLEAKCGPSNEDQNFAYLIKNLLNTSEENQRLANFVRLCSCKLGIMQDKLADEFFEHLKLIPDDIISDDNFIDYIKECADGKHDISAVARQGAIILNKLFETKKAFDLFQKEYGADQTKLYSKEEVEGWPKE